MNDYRDELYHHGIKGQKWGVRRFQNYDGTWIKKAKKGISTIKKNRAAKKVERAYKKDRRRTVRTMNKNERERSMARKRLIEAQVDKERSDANAEYRKSRLAAKDSTWNRVTNDVAQDRKREYDARYEMAKREVSFHTDNINRLGKHAAEKNMNVSYLEITRTFDTKKGVADHILSNLRNENYSDVVSVGKNYSFEDKSYESDYVKIKSKRYR